jgi:hypothetical protein
MIWVVQVSQFWEIKVASLSFDYDYMKRFRRLSLVY